MKISQATFVLIASLMNATIGFADFLIATYVPMALAAASTTFLTAVANGIMVYLATQEDPNDPKEVASA